MRMFSLCVAGTALALAGCGGDEASNDTAVAEQPGAAAEAAGDQTIADGLEQNGRFLEAARAAGLDATLAGPGPYTVLVPTDEAFAGLPEGQFDDLASQANRAQLTRVLTYHILPGTVLVQDIGRAIDASDGEALLATMGGETLTATRDGETIVLSDSTGARASITQPDVRRSNGVVHVIDTVLVPPEVAGAEGEPAAAAE